MSIIRTMKSRESSLFFRVLAAICFLLQIAVSDAKTVLFSGECVREIVDTNLLVARPGASLPPDAHRGICRFEMAIDGCRWVMRARHGIDGFITETAHFTDGRDFFSLSGDPLSRSASISKGPVPSGGLGELQTLWFGLCRPMCPDLDWASQSAFPNLLALQDRVQRQYEETIVTTNEAGAILEAEMFVRPAAGTNLVLMDKFVFSYDKGLAYPVPREVTRMTYGIKAGGATNVPAYKYVVKVTSASTTSTPLKLPAPEGVTRMADYRLFPQGGEGWFVPYAASQWRSEEDLRADPMISAAIKRTAREHALSDELRSSLARRIWRARGLFFAALGVLLAGTIFAFWRTRGTEVAKAKK